MDTIPFFYYDILSRMIPGAATLICLWTFLPNSWTTLFDGQQAWKAVVVPIAMAGICYVIGVFYEALDYTPPMKSAAWWNEDRAFSKAQEKFNTHAEESSRINVTAANARSYRIRLWDRLQFLAASDEKINPVFAHCHRFQAEHKMFFHLIYPSVFVSLCLVRALQIHSVITMVLTGSALAAALAITSFYISLRRNERRWLQVLWSAKQLGLSELRTESITASSAAASASVAN